MKKSIGAAAFAIAVIALPACGDDAKDDTPATTPGVATTLPGGASTTVSDSGATEETTGGSTEESTPAGGSTDESAPDTTGG